jgi:hypothetical protein
MVTPQPTPFVLGRLPRQVYHLAEEANFPSIQRHGLLSASALLDLAGIHGEQRVRLERRQRPVHTKLANGTYLRDQNPMPAHALAGCLIGMEPENWYALINSKVFFWFDAQRMDRQRRACGRRPQMVMVVDTKRLLDCYAEVAALSPINSGHARRKPAVRGRNTFVPYPLWCQSGWDSETAGLGTRPRPRSHRPVELTIEGAVPDIMDFVIHVQQSAPNEPLVDLDDSIAQRTSLLNCDAGRPFGSGSGR